MASALGPMGTVIVSDLHIGAGPLDNCDPELETHIVRFLQEHLTHLAPLELIVNGDLFDFVQTPPFQGSDLESASSDDIPLCFTEDQSLTKLCAIADAHPQIFSALRTFLDTHADNTLVVLPGNHDADFFWPSVQTHFSNLLGSQNLSAGRLRVHLEPVYRPSRCSGIWIEHGHQHDPCNTFTVQNQRRWSTDAPPMLPDATGQYRLLECIGTRFLIRFLNRLDTDYPFVDNVKPFSRFLRLFALSALHPQHGSLKAAVAIWSICEFLASTAITRPQHLLSLLTPPRAHILHPLVRYFRSMSPKGRRKNNFRFCYMGSMV